MISSLFALALILQQDSSGEPPILRAGETLEGEITDGDPEIHTPTLDEGYTDAPVVGRSILVEVDEPGTYTLELRSYLFDSYLVLRDESGALLAEDDDGGIGSHARITTELELGGSYRLEACVVHGERGPFELELRKGKPRVLTPAEERVAERADRERTVEIREKVLGPEHPGTASSLNELARLLKAQGDHAAARPLYERALAICEKQLGPEHPRTAVCLNNLGLLLQVQRDTAGARCCLERALTIREKQLGPEHLDTAQSLNNLGLMLQSLGDYAAAQPLYERAVSVREKQLGPDHPLTVGSIENLAVLLKAEGDYAAARPLFERALAIKEKRLGPEHLDTAATLNNLALLLQDQGDYAAARHLFERALAIRGKRLEPEHLYTATSLNNLALLLHDQGDYAAAQPLFERALAIKEKQVGPQHPSTATSLNNLALSLQGQGNHAAARPLFERALAIREKELGPEHPHTATSLNNLAVLLHMLDDLAAAQPLYERALTSKENSLGPRHPDVAKARTNLSRLLADRGLDSEASELAWQAVASSLAHAWSTLWSLSEKERLLSLRNGEDRLSLVLSLAAGPEQSTGEAAAYDLSLAWRGLVSRTLLESRAQLEASLPEAAAIAIESLSGVQAQLSKLLYATEIPDHERHEREIHDLRERRNELEVELQRVIGPIQERPVDLAELRAHLEPGSAFLDLLVHPLYRPAAREGDKLVRKGEWSDDHVSAWIVRPDRELVHLDLGPAAEIESAVKSWLGQVVGNRTLVAARGIGATESTSTPDGRKLRGLWKPLAEKLDGIQRVFVRADSFLGALPFEVIPLDGGKYLIEEKDFVYVQTPLDLIGAATLPAGGPPTLLAAGDVDFQSAEQGAEDRPKSEPVIASVDLRGPRRDDWPTLPFTGQEVEAIEKLHEASFGESSRLLLERRSVTEERLKQELPRFSVLHLATHGFFNPEGTVSAWDRAQAAAAKDESIGLERETRALVGALPGLLTGLVCAGANEPAPAGRDDGLLTAEEVLWLDLSKVELVVLSASETALGERRAGEGMIGLRRAFGLAGAKTVVSSLWSVKDRSTAELMQRFYENLWLKKQGRAEALRNAQLEMLARNRATEGDALPSTWGAFVLSGEWR